MESDNRKRAAIYTRISRDTEGQGLGVQRQLDDCRAMADRLGMNVVAEYSDNDISAFSGRKRPDYENLLDAIRQNRVDVVLCWNIDRLLRQTKELEQFMDLCEPRSVATYEVTAGQLDLASPSGRATAKTRGAWAQFESEHKAERIKRQKAQAAKAGKWLGGPMPFGWHKVDGEIQPDPVAAELIRTGTDSIIAGRSLISVTRDWADAGATNGGGKRRNTTEVRRTLLRHRNAGLMTFHGEIVSDGWPAIVSLDKFRKCEAILTSGDRPKQSENKFKYLLSGIAKCYCGLYVTGFGAESRRSYRCKVHQEGGRYIPGHANRAMGPLDSYVRQAVAAYLDREDVRAALLAALQQIEDDSQPVQSADIADLLDRKHSLVRLYAQGAITESQLVEGTQEIVSRISALESMAVANGGSRAVTGMLLDDNPGAAFLGAAVDLQREVLRALVSIELQPTGAYRGQFDPESLKIVFGLVGNPQ
ncbi:recombinase family protein [Arthrobacter sp. L77]|uniref:recombinase family protein n=1 Tax=Arthrobacter sp. L77 TaxID=1496689 RepID=UPI0009E65425|nr:recombinase family protein [Arthrobacter sp. L77]